MLWKSIALSQFNANVVLVIVYAPLAYFNLLEQHSTEAKDLPTPLSLALTILFCMMCEDCTFYFSHRFLHCKAIYPYIHKVHHQHKVTIGIASEYAHPVEYALGNLLPASIGPILLGPKMHLISVFAWYAVRVGETLDGHCGYEFSWSPFRLIPFSGSAEYHDFHHSCNVGNYASFFCVWDNIFNTNKDFYDMLE